MKYLLPTVAALLISSAAAFAQYTNILEDGTVQTVTNAWSADTVRVGDATSSNMLQVAAGGLISSTNVFVGGASNAYFNTITMTDTSRWDVANQLVVGDGTGNAVSVLDGSTLSVNNLLLKSGNTLTVDGGGSVEGLASMGVYSNTTIIGQGKIGFGTNDATLAFYGPDIKLDPNIIFSADAGADNLLSYTDSELDVSGFSAAQFVNFGTLDLLNSDLTGAGVLNSFTDITMTGGAIDPAGDNAGSIEIGGAFAAAGTTYRAQVQTSGHDELIFSGGAPIDLSGLNLDLLVSGTTTGAVTILSTAAGLDNSFAAADIVSRPLLYTALLQVTNNAVQVVLAVDDSTVLGSMLDYAATEGIRSGFNGMKNMVLTRTKQLRRNLVSTAHAIPNDVYLLTNTNAPSGAMGPGDLNTIFDMHAWMQHYNGQGDYENPGVTGPFTLNNNGTTFGFDKLIGDALAVGFNYTYARSAAGADNGDALDTETYWIGAYGEWVDAEGLYVDALVGYGYSTYDAERYADSYHGTASYNGHAFGAYADVGQYYYYGDSLALSPYLGLHALTLVADAHNEVEDAGSVVQVEESDHSWLESALGMKMRHRFDTRIGRFQTTGYAEWVYDFIQDDVYSSMSSGGLAVKETERISPDEAGINVGLGYSWICTEYMEVGIGYNGRFSDNFEEHTGSFMFDIMF